MSRTFNVTPPLRRAIIELADAFATFTTIRNNPGFSQFAVPDHAERLRKAQDAFGIELYPRHMLVALEDKKKEAA